MVLWIVVCGCSCSLVEYVVTRSNAKDPLHVLGKRFEAVLSGKLLDLSLAQRRSLVSLPAAHNRLQLVTGGVGDAIPASEVEEKSTPT
jgi:hypothetical protein